MEASNKAVNWTFTYHGSPSGSILGDEIVRDLKPYMGSELCTAVETAYSLAYLYQSLGTNYFADRAELVIFNALPVMLTNDNWAHQYMAQPNAPWTNNTAGPGPRVFTTSEIGKATTYGMEPFYPCCTVNYPQGYPKFLTNSWATVGGSGLAHTLLSPSTVTTTLSGGEVTIECNTAYPFENTLTYTVQSSTSFTFHLRVPTWYIPSESRLTINGVSTPLNPSPSTGMHTLSVPRGKSSITYTIGATIRTESRANNTVSIYVGNLLYALDVGSTNTSSYAHAYYNSNGPGLDYLPYPELRDYYMQNTTAWNVAVDPATLIYYHQEHSGVNHADDDTKGFEETALKSYVTVQGCEIKWGLYKGATPDVPPVSRECISERKLYRMVPYGKAKVHMSELPVVDLEYEEEERFRTQRPELKK